MGTSYQITGDLHFLGFDVSVPAYIKASSFEEAVKQYKATIGEFKRFKEVREYLETIDLTDLLEDLPFASDESAVICVQNVTDITVRETVLSDYSFDAPNSEVQPGEFIAAGKKATVQRDPSSNRNTSFGLRGQSASATIIKIRNHEPTILQNPIEVPQDDTSIEIPRVPDVLTTSPPWIASST
jgi:hypothetical protein